MSADFMSDVRIAPASICERWYRDFKAREWVSDIVGPEEETLFRFDADGHEPVLAELADAYGRGRLEPPLQLGAAYVELDLETWLAYSNDDHPSATHLSSNFASLVVIDRVVAIPHGVSLLGGHAVRHIPSSQLEQFQRDWRGLVIRGGGGKGLARRCRPWIDRGTFEPDELADFIDAIGTLAAEARRRDFDLLLAGYLVP